MGDESPMHRASPQDYARNAVRVWIRQVLDDKGWSANQWANAAGTTPTNVTRLLSPTNTSVPNMETVMKLARVARSQPNLMGVPLDVEPPAETKHPNFCPECGFDLHSITHPARQRHVVNDK